jgi:hypothetical protein
MNRRSFLQAAAAALASSALPAPVASATISGAVTFPATPENWGTVVDWSGHDSSERVVFELRDGKWVVVYDAAEDLRFALDCVNPVQVYSPRS